MGAKKIYAEMCARVDFHSNLFETGEKNPYCDVLFMCQRRCHAECSRDDYRVLHMNLTLRAGRSDRLKSLDAGYTLNDLLDELHQAVVSGPDSGAPLLRRGHFCAVGAGEKTR